MMPSSRRWRRSFYAESKRVSNRRIKEELGYRLIYPTYREGLSCTSLLSRRVLPAIGGEQQFDEVMVALTIKAAHAP